MTFTRTSSGLGNYPAFFKSELVVYIEGKNDGKGTFDEIYYENLIKRLTKKQYIKIKTVGSKQDALAYFEKIAPLESNNSIVIIDKDFIGISSSHIQHKKLFITYGYSWENDFWTLDLCKDVIGTITIGNPITKAEVEKSYRSTLRWASKISALDAACQVSGIALIPKNGSSCGINLSHKGYNFIGTQEFRRHMNKYRSIQTAKCPVAHEILNVAMRQQPSKVVQGHLWEHIVIAIISRHYKKATKSKTVPTEMIKHIAFSKFVEDPLKYITYDCHEHFKNQFSRIVL